MPSETQLADGRTWYEGGKGFIFAVSRIDHSAMKAQAVYKEGNKRRVKMVRVESIYVRLVDPPKDAKPVFDAEVGREVIEGTITLTPNMDEATRFPTAEMYAELGNLQRKCFMGHKTCNTK